VRSRTPQNENKRYSHEELSISKPSPAEFRSEIPNIFTKIVQTIKFGPNPVSKTTEIAKNMHLKN